MTKRIKDPFGASFPEGFTVSEDARVTDPHPEEPARRPRAARNYAPRIDEPHGAPTVEIPLESAAGPRQHLSAAGLAFVRMHWQWKLTQAKCPRCGGARFVNIYDAGAAGPGGIGICGACGEDMRLSRPRRKRLPTWEFR